MLISSKPRTPVVQRGQMKGWSINQTYCEFTGSVLTYHTPIYRFYFTLNNVAAASIDSPVKKDYWKTALLILTVANIGLAAANLPGYHNASSQPVADFWKTPVSQSSLEFSANDPAINLNQTEQPKLAAPVPSTPDPTPVVPRAADKVPPKTSTTPIKPGTVSKRPPAGVILEELAELSDLSIDNLHTYENMTMESTAYTHTGSRTATGVSPRHGVVAVDPRVIPLGSRLYVAGCGPAVAADTGGLIKGQRIDIFLDSETQCQNWGRRKVKVYLLRKGA